MTDRKDLILVLNCGSSSIKFALFDAAPARCRASFVERQGAGHRWPGPDFGETGVCPFAIELDGEHPYRAALTLIRERVLARLDGRKIAAIAHRVVHGGSKYFDPVRIDATVLADLKAYIPLAPLHQPFALEAIEILLRDQPELPQVACFDTGFHHTMPKVEQMLPLPTTPGSAACAATDSTACRTSTWPLRCPNAMATRRAAQHRCPPGQRCQPVRDADLRSVATTMGFSALDGLMMGTRTGALDPGAVLYLMEIEKLSSAQVGEVLYHRVGLLGVSGISAEPRVLVRHEQDEGERGERARIALALYVRRIVREIGALVAVLGGLDLLVFTAGVGEHCAFVRQRVCHALAFLGITLDDRANQADEAIISTTGSLVRVAVERTNEEWIAARDTVAALTAPP
ncbi:MAG: acetate kinase [Chiayiivirga sp.]|jgi:acetate kinase|nr:acetate kinase [Chiayiivirga sp.]